jgi:hypothetical protein
VIEERSIVQVLETNYLIEVAEEDAVRVIEASSEQVFVIQPSMVGPQGPPGEAGDLIVSDHLAGEALGGHRGVIVGNDNRLYYADQSNLTHFNRVLGITTGAAGEDDPAIVRVGGIMAEPTWNWDLARFIYLGTNGLLTQTAPVTGFLLEIGWPVSPTSMMVHIKIPLFLAA